jgi:Fic family protein
MEDKKNRDQKVERLKQKILSILKQGPARKSDIYSGLAKSVSNEKALQRLLSTMQDEGLIQATGDRKARIYSLPNKNKRVQSLMMPIPLKAADMATQKTFSAYMPYLERYFNLKPAERGWIGFEPERIAEYPELHGKLLTEESLSILNGLPSWDDETDLGSTYAEGAAKTFLLQFSFNSSKLEGAVDSLADTLSIMEHPDRYDDDEKKIIIMNHKRAVETLIPWIIDPNYNIEAELTRNARVIKEIHALLMEGLLKDESEGEVRHEEVKISGSSYLPSKNFETLEKSLHEIAFQAGKIEEPFERSFFLLAQLAYLQAFRDGNKRTARLISNIPLIASKKAPHVFSSIEEDEFDKAMVFYYETADARPLQRLWLESYIEGVKLFQIAQKDYKIANLDRAALAPLRWLVIKEIIQNHASQSEFPKIAEKVLMGSELKTRYPVEVLLSHVNSGLEKLYRSSIGALAHGISEQEIEDWRKIFKKL